MPWIYQQSSGRLYRNGTYVGTGYSGHGSGKNNSAMQGVAGIGPIPTGSYDIGAPFNHPQAGPYALRLTPKSGTYTYGRSGFLIHGDSLSNPGQASEGCIVESHPVRQQVWESGDHVLEVMP